MGRLLGTFPTVNRVGSMGSAKVPQLRNVELTGPYFHNGGKLTLRQVVNFYAHGGDFPVTNVAAQGLQHRQPGPRRAISADRRTRSRWSTFLLSLTDERVAHEQAPFDRPELVPADLRIVGGKSTRQVPPSEPASPTFRRVSATPVGAAGHPERLPAFMNISSTPVAGTDNDQFDQ